MAGRPRAKMPVSERAKQFASFKALGGLDEALERKRREMGFEERKILSAEQEEEIDRILSGLTSGQSVEISVYLGGKYETKTVTFIKTDILGGVLLTEEGEIRIADIGSVKEVESK